MIEHYIAAGLLCAIVAFAIAAAQAFMGVKIGTDHPGHVFLVRAIRDNGYRLFTRVPRLLNHAIIGAIPLYLHAIFARLGERAMFWAERLLNPAMSAAQILIFAILAYRARTSDTDGLAAILATVACFAFCPQFTHALSARNFGLSSRSIGLAALTVCLSGAWLAERDPAFAAGWLLGLGGAFAVWAFSTFAAQALVLLVAGMALAGGHYTPGLMALGGLAGFVAVHPRFAPAYLRDTIAFLREYRRELAPLYILARRFSVWRDLWRDIPRALCASPVAGLRYAYENPVLIVVLLNPLTLAAAYARLADELAPGLPAFAGDVTLAGLAAMVATSLRATRFLGEPERYVEAVTPWSALAASGWIAGRFGADTLEAIAVVFVILAVVQLGLFRILFRYIISRPLDIAGAERAIAAFAPPGGVRLASNNEHMTKLFMYNDWDFAYCIAVGRGYAGMSITEAFERFPILRQSAFENVLERYRINVCVLDRKIGDQPFRSAPESLAEARLLHESEALRCFGLSWREEA